MISPRPFHLVNCLDNLRQRHPDCYTFSLGNGRGDHFIGASPERLLTVHQGQLITDALAGSAPGEKMRSKMLSLPINSSLVKKNNGNIGLLVTLLTKNCDKLA